MSSTVFCSIFFSYTKYAKNLSEIKTCSKTFDLRNVFDAEIESIYWDQGHVSDSGNAIVAQSLLDEVLPVVLENKGFNTFETDNKKASLPYNDREIVVNVDLTPSNKFENKNVKITTYDNTNHEHHGILCNDQDCLD